MSQQDLADAAGVSRRWLIDLEAGKPRAELSLVLRVLSALGVRLVVHGAGDAPRDHAGERSGAMPAAVIDLDFLLGQLAEPR